MDEDISDQQILTQIAHISGETNLSDDQVERIVKFTCNRFNIKHVVVSIAIVDNQNIQQINSKFLEKDKNTDCISFDLSDNENEKLFEIIVNAELAVHQSQNNKHNGETELALYIVHGLLHQIGFDDLEPEKAKKMHKEEENILRELGYDFSYN